MSCVQCQPFEVHVVALATVTLVTGTENHIVEWVNWQAHKDNMTHRTTQLNVSFQDEPSLIKIYHDFFMRAFNLTPKLNTRNMGLSQNWFPLWNGHKMKFLTCDMQFWDKTTWNIPFPSGLFATPSRISHEIPSHDRPSWSSQTPEGAQQNIR